MRENPIARAMAMTEMDVGIVKADTRSRRKWSYIREDSLIDWAHENWVDEEGMDDPAALQLAQAVKFFKKPAGTPAKRGQDIMGTVLFAVWNGKEAEPDVEPEFIRTAPPPDRAAVKKFIDDAQVSRPRRRWVSMAMGMGLVLCVFLLFLIIMMGKS